LISGIRNDPALDLGRRLLWGLPLVLVCMVSLTTSIAWGPRFLLPAIPIISLLGPQFLDLSFPSENRDRIKKGLLFLVGLGIFLIIRLIMRVLLARMGWDPSLLYIMVYEPVILSVILAIAFLWKRLSGSISVILAVMIIALLVSPLSSNARIMFSEKNRALSDIVFYPYSTFSKEIHYQTGDQMFVSLVAWKALNVGPYCKTIDGVVDLFNIYFDVATHRSDFTVPTDPAAFEPLLTSTTYAFLLMSETEWQAVPQAVRNILQQQYNPLEDKKGVLVFLKPK
jgi:hypothetical protein